MTEQQIQMWFSCAMPGVTAAVEAIVFARLQAQEYVFEFELRDIFEAYPQSDFEPTFAVFLASLNLEVTTEDIPPFGEVQIIYIDKPYIDQIIAALSDPNFDNVCRVWGFNGTSYPL